MLPRGVDHARDMAPSPCTLPVLETACAGVSVMRTTRQYMSVHGGIRKRTVTIVPLNPFLSLIHLSAFLSLGVLFSFV